MNLTQHIGDSKTHRIPLRWDGRPFVAGTAWSLIWTVKESTSLPDSQCVMQKASPALGIAVSGNTAEVEILRVDTFREEDHPSLGAPAFEAQAGDYLWDIRATELAGEFRTRTVANGTLTLLPAVTQLTSPTGPIFTTEDPVLAITGPAGPAGQNGAPGTNGTNGQDGVDGQDGTPILVSEGDPSNLAALWFRPSTQILSIYYNGRWLALNTSAVAPDPSIPNRALANSAGGYYRNSTGGYYIIP